MHPAVPIPRIETEAEDKRKCLVSRKTAARDYGRSLNINFSTEFSMANASQMPPEDKFQVHRCESV